MSQAKYKILGLGTPVIDHILRVSQSYLDELPGKKGGMLPVDIETFRHILETSHVPDVIMPGGSCANAIRGLAMLGHSCAFMGKIGRDLAADHFYKELKRLHITPLLLAAKENTAQVISLVGPDGQRTMRTLLSASREMTASDLAPNYFIGAKLFHVEGYTLLNGGLTKKAMKLAKNARASISFDIGSFEMAEQYRDQIITLLRDYVDIVFANDIETLTLTQKSSLEEGCIFLKNLCKVAVVMKGKKGCLVGSAKGIIEGSSFPIEHPIDTTGAGDFFASGFLHGYLSGWPLENSARLGALLGAAAVQVIGATIPNDQLENIKKEMVVKKSSQ